MFAAGSGEREGSAQRHASGLLRITAQLCGRGRGGEAVLAAGVRRLHADTQLQQVNQNNISILVRSGDHPSCWQGSGLAVRSGSGSVLLKLLPAPPIVCL